MRVAAFPIAVLLVVAPALLLREPPPLTGREVVAAASKEPSSWDPSTSELGRELIARADLRAGTEYGTDLSGRHRRRGRFPNVPLKWRCWPFDGGIVVSVASLGDERCLAVVLDAEGQLAGALPFESGFAFRSPDAETPFARVARGSDILAITSRGFVLVRTLDENGRLARRFFHRSERANLERLFAALHSNDEVEQLDALSWFSGFQDTLSGHASLPRSPEVRKRIHELAESENAWVREAARLALEEP